MGWLKKMIDEGDSLNLLGADIEKLTMLKWGNTVEEEKTLPAIWHGNIEKNIAYLASLNGRVQSARKIPDMTGKAVIFVGASPILNDTWHFLKQIDDRFIVVASNSSAKFLIENGIDPDYILMIDGQKGQWSLDISNINPKTAMIASPFCEPTTLQNWKNAIYVLPYEVKDSKYIDIIRKTYGEPIPAGGNSINCGVAFFVSCTNARIYLFMGNELSFKKSYYNDRGSSNDASMYFFSKNSKGETVRTLIPLYEYKVWLENLMWELYRESYWFCNCSEGILGVDDGEQMQCVAQMPADEAIEQVKKAWDFEQQNEIVKTKQMYDLIYQNTTYLPKNGIYTWLSYLNNIELGKLPGFKKGLDVGCGVGAGMIEAVNRGYNVYGVDIADNKVLWEKMGIADRCLTAPAHDIPYPDNSFDFVMCGDVMEHIPGDWVDRSLKEILRVGSDLFIFTIATGTASVKGGAIQAHHTICPGEWWGNLLIDLGYKICHYHEEEDHHVVIAATKEDICQKK